MLAMNGYGNEAQRLPLHAARRQEKRHAKRAAPPWCRRGAAPARPSRFPRPGVGPQAAVRAEGLHRVPVRNGAGPYGAGRVPDQPRRHSRRHGAHRVGRRAAAPHGHRHRPRTTRAGTHRAGDRRAADRPGRAGEAEAGTGCAARAGRTGNGAGVRRGSRRSAGHREAADGTRRRGRGPATRGRLTTSSAGPACRRTGTRATGRRSPAPAGTSASRVFRGGGPVRRHLINWRHARGGCIGSATHRDAHHAARRPRRGGIEPRVDHADSSGGDSQQGVRPRTRRLCRRQRELPLQPARARRTRCATPAGGVLSHPVSQRRAGPDPDRRRTHRLSRHRREPSSGNRSVARPFSSDQRASLPRRSRRPPAPCAGAPPVRTLPAVASGRR